MKSFIIFVLCLVSFNSFAKDDSAFQEFGGKKVIKKVVDDMMINLLSDKRTKKFFEFTDREHTKKMLREQFCELLGGPCKYSGKSMKKAHEDQEISRSHFYALAEQLQKAMDKNDVKESAQNKLMAKLAVMHKDVVTK